MGGVIPTVNMFGKTWEMWKMVVKSIKGKKITVSHIKRKAISYVIGHPISCTLDRTVVS